MMTSSSTPMVCFSRLPKRPLQLMSSRIDRYKMAAQWYGLPKLFPKSERLGYEVVRNDDTLIQIKYKQVSSTSPPVSWHD